MQQQRRLHVGGAVAPTDVAVAAASAAHPLDGGVGAAAAGIARVRRAGGAVQPAVGGRVPGVAGGVARVGGPRVGPVGGGGVAPVGRRRRGRRSPHRSRRSSRRWWRRCRRRRSGCYAAGDGVRMQPLAGTQLSVVHTLLSLQSSGPPITQTPAMQRSMRRCTCCCRRRRRRWPWAGSCTSRWPGRRPPSWHWSEAGQTVAVEPAQAPAWQVSPVVHMLPSLQTEPFVLGGLEHMPVPGSHTPTSWHWDMAVQVTAGPGWQTPPA